MRILLVVFLVLAATVAIGTVETPARAGSPCDPNVQAC